MRDAGRHLTADDLQRCAEQYKKLKAETAPSIVRLREQRLRMQSEEVAAADARAEIVQLAS
jgi:hypothetical protein